MIFETFKQYVARRLAESMRSGKCQNCGAQLTRKAGEASAFCSQKCYDAYNGHDS